MASPRLSTPPRPDTVSSVGPTSPLTPEQVRRTEINRLKAKALREQKERETAADTATLKTSESAAAGQKRSFATYSQPPTTSRDARTEVAARPLEAIQPARNFAKYVDYDFGKMTDTKGGFLTAEDDPHNKALHAREDGDERPANMTLEQWNKQEMLRKLQRERAGPFEPGISAARDADTKACRECGILEVDWKWADVFGIAVCNSCKDKFPDKYSLLTKSEAREDYLLTDPELKDEKLLPHLERPNPHKSTWHPMSLYLRCQVEEYAFSSKRWGSAEALDEEFVRRERDKKKRKESKFKSKLADLKKRTRLEAHQRRGKGGGGGNFGDDLGDGKHVHEFGRAVENLETGMPVKKCIECGLEVEELEL